MDAFGEPRDDPEPPLPSRPGLSELLPFGQAAGLEHKEPPRRQISPAKATIAALTAVAFGLIFRFPLPVLLVLAVAGAAVVGAASRWRRGAHVAATVFAAGFLAQATSIFVTPFTWWLRFGFFGTLIGAYVLLIVWQTREL
jgi:uncharacterized membrane protein